VQKICKITIAGWRNIWNDLIDKHPGKIVAVMNGEIVGIGDSYQKVYAPFQNQHLDWMPFAVRVPHPDDVQEFLL